MWEATQPFCCPLFTDGMERTWCHSAGPCSGWQELHQGRRNVFTRQESDSVCVHEVRRPEAQAGCWHQ